MAGTGIFGAAAMRNVPGRTTKSFIRQAVRVENGADARQFSLELLDALTYEGSGNRE